MSQPLVAYFSATGTTAKVAGKLAAAANAALYEIKPAVPYTIDDLNWTDKQSRSSLEMAEPGFRPALADKNAPVPGCGTVYLGFPIWWYIAPPIVNSFLEAYDFSGKKIVLFATSGGSDFGKTADALQTSAPSAAIVPGKILNGRLSNRKLKNFLEKY